jgi:hypothetical protein
MAATKDEQEETPINTFVPFYEKGVQIYMSLKLSKDGLSREEDVDVLKGMYEDEKVRNIGLKVRRKVFGRKGIDDDDGAGVG